MLRLLFVGVLSLSAVFLRVSAQQIGDTQDAVRAALGPPQMSRESRTGVVWLYEGGGRLTFKDGVVVAVEGVQPPKPDRAPGALPMSEPVAVVPPARPTPSPDARIKVPPKPYTPPETLPMSAPVTVAPPVRPAPSPKVRLEVPKEQSTPGSASEPAISPRKLGGMLVVLAGVAIVSVVCQIIILIKAFQTSVWWGLGSLFVPFFVLIFVACNWSEARKPFLVNLAAAGVLPVLIFVM